MMNNINLAKNNRLFRLLAYNFKGMPIGVVIGVAIMAGSITYAAPKVLDSKNTTATPSSQSSPASAHQNTSATNRSTTSSNGSTNPTNSTQSTSTTQNPSLPKNSSGSPTASASPTNTPSNSSVVSKPTPTVTGIAVITPDPGANQNIYIPYCDFGSISSGGQETCNHYRPINFTLVATLSDGSTRPIAWSDASVSSANPTGGHPYIPTLLNIDKTNSTLIEGTGMGYFLNDHTQNAVVRIDVTYQGWTYAKYIHIYVNSLWG